jgi:hypothetical protein
MCPGLRFLGDTGSGSWATLAPVPGRHSRIRLHSSPSHVPRRVRARQGGYVNGWERAGGALDHSAAESWRFGHSESPGSRRPGACCLRRPCELRWTRLASNMDRILLSGSALHCWQPIAMPCGDRRPRSRPRRRPPKLGARNSQPPAGREVAARPATCSTWPARRSETLGIDVSFGVWPLSGRGADSDCHAFSPSIGRYCARFSWRC